MSVFPVIDPVATGANIVRLRKARNLSVRDIQAFFGFEEPQAIYKWQKGKSLPTVDNLYALAALFEVSMEQILVSTEASHLFKYLSKFVQPCQSKCDGVAFSLENFISKFADTIFKIITGKEFDIGYPS